MDMLDFRPQVEPIHVVSSDSVYFVVKVSDMTAFPDAVWSAQVRDEERTVVEPFVCSPLPSGCDVLLPSAAVSRLAAAGTGDEVVVMGSTNFRKVWDGVWDLQVRFLNDTNGLPTRLRTIIQGTFSVYEEVTI